MAAEGWKRRGYFNRPPPLFPKRFMIWSLELEPEIPALPLALF
jgi:hypothetical protein